MELLEKEKFVDETSIFGNNIHLNVNSNYKDENQITNLIEKENRLKVISIDKIVPTLEDVFIHLLDNKTDV